MPRTLAAAARGLFFVGLVALAFLACRPGTAAAQANPHAPGWIADRNGCKLWDAYPEAGESVEWSGGCSDGFASGAGVAEWRLDERLSGHYEGGYKVGRMDGHGVFTYDSGNRYDGEWHADRRNGHGSYSWSNGDRYEGEWKNSKENGRGVLVRANGERYEGDFKGGLWDGEGVYTLADGGRYEGHFVAGLPEGTGTYRDAKGATYIGTWRKGCYRWVPPRIVQDFSGQQMRVAGETSRSRSAALGVDPASCR